MMPAVLSLRIDRRVARAGITLAQVVGAFVAQLSTRAANQMEILVAYSTGGISRSEAMEQLGCAEVRELMRIMADHDVPLPQPAAAQFQALAQRLVAQCVKSRAPASKPRTGRPGIARKDDRPRTKAR